MVLGRRGEGGGSSSGRTPGSGPGSGGSNPPPPASSVAPVARPHRLEAQDTALSRLKHGFESRWGHHVDFVDLFRSVFEEHRNVPRTRNRFSEFSGRFATF